MGKADLHAHTCHDGWGDGNQTVAELFRYVEDETDLDVFGITDHDSADAARAGWELYRSGGFRFGYLPGVEVTNRAGHLLCYFPAGNVVDIPSFRPFWWTVRYAMVRGAICVPAHPIYPPWLAGVIRRGLDNGHRLDALEVVNAGIGEGGQSKLDQLGATFESELALLGSSDAHDRTALGAGYTYFPGETVDDFLAALRNRRTEPVLVRRPVMDPQAKRFTTRRSMTRPGWVRNLWREALGK
jgi:hypothetical protein